MSVNFRCRTLIAAEPSAVCAASLSIDAHLASMAASGERAVDGMTSGQIGLGDTVTWRARHFGVVWQMTSRVTELDAPSRFVDEQVRGPFQRFRHEHLFDRRDSGTEMVDVISFTAPLGPLGFLAEKLALQRYLPHLIRERNRYLKQSLENEPA